MRDFLPRWLDAAIIVFALLLALALVLYSVGARLRRLWLMLLVRMRWFPQGVFVLACTTGDEGWDGYLADTLSPLLEDSAVIADMREKASETLEARLARELIHPLADPRVVIVFMPYLEHRAVEFGHALDIPVPEEGAEGERGPRERALARTTKALMELVEQGRDRMRLYI